MIWMTVKTSTTRPAAIVLLLMSVLLGACNRVELRPDPAYAPLRPSAMRAPENNDGAIYQAGWGMRLFEDRRARQVGDILTVQLSETTNATTENTTSTFKSSTITAPNPALLGTAAQFSLPGGLPLATSKNLDLSVTQNSDQTFDGEGTSEQSNSLNGFISVTVVEVLPNRNLVVRGEKLINLNRGNEFVRISGIVRPEDITADNVVQSTRIANVGISYAGTGELADSSSMGWLTRFFNSSLWPF